MSPPQLVWQDIHTVLARFGHAAFRGRQEEIIRYLQTGRHCLVVMPTGGGKSLCYQLPALATEGLTVVISPLIALMQDQVQALRAKGIDAAYLNSALGRKEREKRLATIRGGGYCLLYVTPERFRKPVFLESIRQRRVSLLAVDEAHCISEWGHDFRPDYTRLREFRALLGDPVTIALTATATPEVQRDIVAQLGLGEGVACVLSGIARPNLHLQVEKVWGLEAKVDYLCQLRQRREGNGVVYFSLIKTLEACSAQLAKLGWPHLVYHGQLPAVERRRVQERFMGGEGQTILATNAFGMGIDKENIRYVVHAEIPGSLEAYYQEIGRAGRDGLAAECTLLYDEQDLLIQMDFISWSNPDAEFYREVHARLREDPEQVNALGLEGLKEKVVYKNRHDYRLETALKIMERQGVLVGDLERGDLAVCGELPAVLFDRKQLQAKLRRQQLQLHALVQYAKSDGCRRAFIHDYFGLPLAGDGCGACDRCP